MKPLRAQRVLFIKRRFNRFSRMFCFYYPFAVDGTKGLRRIQRIIIIFTTRTQSLFLPPVRLHLSWGHWDSREVVFESWSFLGLFCALSWKLKTNPKGGSLKRDRTFSIGWLLFAQLYALVVLLAASSLFLPANRIVPIYLKWTILPPAGLKLWSVVWIHSPEGNQTTLQLSSSDLIFLLLNLCVL